MWVRAPALLFAASLQYVALAHGTTKVPCVVNACCAALLAFNAMYYAASSVRSAARSRLVVWQPARRSLLPFRPTIVVHQERRVIVSFELRVDRLKRRDILAVPVLDLFFRRVC